MQLEIFNISATMFYLTRCFNIFNIVFVVFSEKHEKKEFSG